MSELNECSSNLVPTKVTRDRSSHFHKRRGVQTIGLHSNALIIIEELGTLSPGSTTAQNDSFAEKEPDPSNSCYDFSIISHKEANVYLRSFCTVRSRTYNYKIISLKKTSKCRSTSLTTFHATNLNKSL